MKLKDNMLNKISDVFLWIWQLPQNVVGLIVVKILNAERCPEGYYSSAKIDASVSLGDYIIFAFDWNYLMQYLKENTIKHELGHQKQSRMLGWLYLPLVGLPSILRNIYNRIFHKGSAWYYGGYPENWADKLGGVRR
jgi:hypothetical protein